MWPSTPLTSYVAGTTPWISAADMNALQGGVNGLVNGTFSLKAAVIDGSGGSVVSPPAGSIQVTGAVGGGTSWPTPAWAQGTVFKDSLTLGWARAYWDGTNMILYAGFNVLSLGRTGVGAYTVIFQPVVGNAYRAGVLTSAGQNHTAVTNGLICNVVQISSNSGRVEVHVQMLDPKLGPNVVEAGTDIVNWFYVEAKAA